MFLFKHVTMDNFAKRLQKIISYYGESASSFAEKINVQRSSISHVLSGRNKPSLDFVLKIQSSFPEVELHWLLNGKGDFLSNKKSATINQDYSEKKLSDRKIQNNIEGDKIIERIVVFYSDGTFKNFQNH